MTKKNDLQEVMEKLETFEDKYRNTARRLHEIIMTAAPELEPRLWYGMPGYAKSKSSPVLMYFRADKYMTFGLTENAAHEPKPFRSHKLMATAWFFTGLDRATEEMIGDIIKDAMK